MHWDGLLFSEPCREGNLYLSLEMNMIFPSHIFFRANQCKSYSSKLPITFVRIERNICLLLLLLPLIYRFCIFRNCKNYLGMDGWLSIRPGGVKHLWQLGQTIHGTLELASRALVILVKAVVLHDQHNRGP